MTKLARYSNVCAVALRLYPRYIQPYLSHPRYPLWCRTPSWKLRRSGAGDTTGGGNSLKNDGFSDG
jgi:hypothetical protein